VLRATEGDPDVVLIGTGSEVQHCVAAAETLAAEGVAARVVSMPSWELFDEQPADYRADLLPADVLKVSIEAGVTLGWQKYIGDGVAIGIDRYGASAPAEVLFEHFGFSVEKIVPRIVDRLR